MDFVQLFNILTTLIASTEFLKLERLAILGNENDLRDFVETNQGIETGLFPIGYVSCSA